jgi:hypothetical protein
LTVGGSHASETLGLFITAVVGPLLTTVSVCVFDGDGVFEPETGVDPDDATVPDFTVELELLALCDVEVVPVDALPESSPQAESATTTDPSSERQAIRYDPNPRLAFLMRSVPPNCATPKAGQIRNEGVTVGRVARSRDEPCELAVSSREVCVRPLTTPATPLS